MELGFGEIQVVGNVPNHIVEYIQHRLGKPFGFSINKCESHSNVSFVIARRFNVGNINHDGRIILEIPNEKISRELVDEFIEEFVDVTSLESGDLVLNSEDYAITSIPNLNFENVQMQDCAVEAAPTPTLPAKTASPTQPQNKRKLRYFFEEFLHFNNANHEHYLEADSVVEEQESVLLKERNEIDSNRAAELEEIRRAVIRYVTTYHSDPNEFIQELIRGKIVMTPNGISRLTVNAETHIFLPDYDEAEVRLTAMERSLYILFLLHPEGIKQSDVCDHIDELVSIYGIVKPGAREENIKRYVENVCNVGSDALRQNISRIKKAFKDLIPNDDIARNYYISGERNGIYKIELEREKVLLPAVFTL